MAEARAEADAVAGGPVSDFLRGAGFIGRGLRLWITAPRLVLVGILPALLVAVVYVAVVVAVFLHVDALGAWSTPFAADLAEPFRSLVRGAASLVLFALVVVLAVLTFTALSLAVGDPFYERIWRRVEARLGGIPNAAEPSFWRGVGESLRVLLLAGAITATIAVGGLIPVVGQTLVPVLGVLVGGWFLALELTTWAFEARGLRLAERRRILRSNRALTLGFGCGTYLLFLIPFAAILLMPTAVAGGTLLARAVLDEEGRRPKTTPFPTSRPISAP